MGIFGKKCSNCGNNPCPPACALQAYPNPRGSLARDVNPPSTRARPLGRDKDSAYNRAKERQAAEGKPHLARRLTADDVKNGVFDKMARAGDVDLEKSKIGREGGVVILKNGKQGKWTEYET